MTHQLALIVAAVLMVAGLVFASVHLVTQPAEHDGGPTSMETTAVPTSDAPVAPPPVLPKTVPETDAPAMPEGALATAFAALEQNMASTIGLAVQPINNPSEAIQFGSWQQGPAWSTIKVPLAIAAIRASTSPTVTDAARAAITLSDNAAAEQLWSDLGEPSAAAQKVQQVLTEAGDPSVVQSERIRPGFTAFGQTLWPLKEQAAFLAHAACDPRDEPVLALMGDIASDQSWGLGEQPAARFKGGWGPDEAGSYLVRQFGLLTTTDGGALAVAVAAQPHSGVFQDGIRDLTQVTRWIGDRLDKLPSGRCDGD